MIHFKKDLSVKAYMEMHDELDVTVDLIKIMCTVIGHQRYYKEQPN